MKAMSNYTRVISSFWEIAWRQFIFCALFLFIINDGLSAGKKWTGSVNSDWNVANNWEGSTLPDITSDIIIDPVNYTGVAANPVISSNSIFQINTLKIDNAAMLIIQADLTCTSQIAINAGSSNTNTIINMSAGMLTITGTAYGDDFNIGHGGTFHLSGGTVIIGYFTSLGNFSQTGGNIQFENTTTWKNAGTYSATGGAVIFNGNTTLAIAAGPPTIDLGTAVNFSILAGAGVANTGLTSITGDIGTSPTSTVTGFPPGSLTGTIHYADVTAGKAQIDLTAAYSDAQGRTGGAIMPVNDLKGLIFTPGLYTNYTSVTLSADSVILDAQGDSNAVFIFQVGTTLTTNTGTKISLTGGAQPNNVFWVVGTSATLGTYSIFNGNIMADPSITLNTGARLFGRALAIGGAVTLDSNRVDNTSAITLSYGDSWGFNNLIINAGDSLHQNTVANINVAGDWTNNGGVYSHNNKKVTFNGTLNSQTIGGSFSTIFNDLTLNNTFGIIPQIISNVNIDVKNILNMTSGIVNLASNTFTLGSSAVASTLTRMTGITTNWMYGGTFKRYWLASTAITSTSDNYYGLFPMGTSGSNSYRPVEINTTVSPSGSGYFTVNHIDSQNTVTDLNPFYLDGDLEIKRIQNSQFITAISGVSGGTYNISVTTTGLPAGDLNDIRLAVYLSGTTASAVGTHAAATGTAQNPTAYRTGITLVTDLNNDFRIATTNLGNTPIPVKLLSFAAIKENALVKLYWVTASEFNNDYFAVERSVDGLKFETITIVEAIGNSQDIQKYSVTDQNPYLGVSYYRLKQTDYNGSFEYSKIVSVNFSMDLGYGLNVFPNPTRADNIKITISGEAGNEVMVMVYDFWGSPCYSKRMIAGSGNYTITLGKDNTFAPGIYTVTLLGSKECFSKIIVIR
jgi:hypothetical protein